MRPLAMGLLAPLPATDPAGGSPPAPCFLTHSRVLPLTSPMASGSRYCRRPHVLSCKQCWGPRPDLYSVERNQPPPVPRRLETPGISNPGGSPHPSLVSASPQETVCPGLSISGSWNRSKYPLPRGKGPVGTATWLWVEGAPRPTADPGSPTVLPTCALTPPSS